MAPIIGIIASSKYITSNSYESIATVSVGSGGSSSIEFTSIASTWTHLQIRFIARSTATSGVGLRMQLNGITTGSYSTHILYGDGSSAAADNSAPNSTLIFSGVLPNANNTANCFSGGVIDILDYTNTNKYKTTRTLSGGDYNGSGYVALESGLYQSTNAITSIKLFSSTGNLAQYSSAALYGIKG